MGLNSVTHRYFGTADSRVFSQKQMDLVVSKYISTSQGRATLAKAMHNPKRTTRDYMTCPECEVLIIIDPGSRDNMRHPENGCKTGILMGVMES